MNTGKCPKCERAIAKVDHEPVIVGSYPKNEWNGISYICPHCRTVLSVQIDPISIYSDIMQAINKR
jgi:hypothetical protein